MGAADIFLDSLAYRDARAEAEPLPAAVDGVEDDPAALAERL